MYQIILKSGEGEIQILCFDSNEALYVVLRIDKGSRAASHVFRYSIGTINSTVTIYIPYER